MDEILEQCRRVAEQFPDIRDGALTLANYEVWDATEALCPLPELGQGARADLPRRGGFCRDRAIRHALQMYRLRWDAETYLLRYPLVVVVTPGECNPLREEGLRDLGACLPEVGGFLTSTPTQGLTRASWEGTAAATEQSNLRQVPVVIMRRGTHLEAVSPSAPGGLVAMAFQGAGDEGLSYFNPDMKAFQSLDDVAWIDFSTRYGRGAEGWWVQASADRDTERAFQVRRLLHNLSRDSGILLPGTSYMVVENSAQWKMLEETEKRKLGEFEELEVASTPEPATWALLAAGVTALLLKKRAPPSRTRSSLLHRM